MSTFQTWVVFPQEKTDSRAIHHDAACDKYGSALVRLS